MQIKKLLCKYFSEEDGKTVTIGSLFDNIVDYTTRIESMMLYVVLFVLASISFLTGAYFTKKYTLPADKLNYFDVIYITVYGGVIILLCCMCVYIVYKIYGWSHKIEITKCERKD